MNLWYGLAFAAMTVGWFLLPLVPAILELLHPSDVAPLRVVPRDAGDVSFLARGFRQYLGRQMNLLPAATPADFLGRLPDGTHFARVKAGPDVLRPGEPGTTQDRVVRVDTPIALAGNQTFLQEVHATEDFVGGPQTVYRALLGERRITLGERSRVLRWVHAGGALTIGGESALQGRISSDESVTVGPGVEFDRIGAPEIRTTGSAAPARAAATGGWQLPDGARRIGDHHRIDGDLEIGAGVKVIGSLVVTGRLTVRQGAEIHGSVKVHGDVTIERAAAIRGSLVGRRNVVVGPAAEVLGPVIGDGEVSLGDGSSVGRGDAQTTVAAGTLKLGRGVAVFGQIMARDGGRTTN